MSHYSQYGQHGHYCQFKDLEEEPHEINAMLAKLTMECLIEKERGENLLLQGIILIMLEDNDYGVFMNRFINVILEVFDEYKKMILNIWNCLLCDSIMKKEKLWNILAPEVYYKWVEVIEKIKDQWWNSDTF